MIVVLPTITFSLIDEMHCKKYSIKMEKMSSIEKVKSKSEVKINEKVHYGDWRSSD
jgi:hypothetical protein